MGLWICYRFPYQFIFEPLALDVELHSCGAGTGAWTGTGTGARTGATRAEVVAASSAASTVGAAAVLCSADLIDSDTAKASTPQGKPPTAGVIPSHDHCSHTRITVTVEEKGKNMRKVEGIQRQRKSKRKTMVLVNIISSNQHLMFFINHHCELYITRIKKHHQNHTAYIKYQPILYSWSAV